MSLLLPRFLTPGIARQAINMAIEVTFNSLTIRQLMTDDPDINCHIVILVPSMDVVDEEHSSSKWPVCEIKPHCLYQKSFGDKTSWKHPFDEIAQCKGIQLWDDRNDGGTDIVPHLLFPGDTPWWGGVKRERLVVSCSGFRCHFDKLVAGITADICIALARNAWMTSEAYKEKPDFLE